MKTNRTFRRKDKTEDGGTTIGKTLYFLFFFFKNEIQYKELKKKFKLYEFFKRKHIKYKESTD